MNRRTALKALAAIPGLTVMPVTTHEAQGVALVTLKFKGRASADTVVRLRQTWIDACKGTALEQAKVIVLDDGIDVELIRAGGAHTDAGKAP